MRSAGTVHPALARLDHTGCDTCPASLSLLALLALKILLNATQKLKSLRIKVKSRKDVSQLNKVWLINLQSKLVISKGTRIGRLKSVMLKDLLKLNNYKRQVTKLFMEFFIHYLL